MEVKPRIAEIVEDEDTIDEDVVVIRVEREELLVGVGVDEVEDGVFEVDDGIDEELEGLGDGVEDVVEVLEGTLEDDESEEIEELVLIMDEDDDESDELNEIELDDESDELDTLEEGELLETIDEVDGIDELEDMTLDELLRGVDTEELEETELDVLLETRLLELDPPTRFRLLYIDNLDEPPQSSVASALQVMEQVLPEVETTLPAPRLFPQ